MGSSRVPALDGHWEYLHLRPITKCFMGETSPDGSRVNLACQEWVGTKASTGYSSFGSTAGIKSDTEKKKSKKGLENQLAAKGNYQRAN